LKNLVPKILNPKTATLMAVLSLALVAEVLSFRWTLRFAQSVLVGEPLDAWLMAIVIDAAKLILGVLVFSALTGRLKKTGFALLVGLFAISTVATLGALERMDALHANQSLEANPTRQRLLEKRSRLLDQLAVANATEAKNAKSGLFRVRNEMSIVVQKGGVLPGGATAPRDFRRSEILELELGHLDDELRELERAPGGKATAIMPYLAALGLFSNLPAEAMRVLLNLVLASMVECIALFCGTFLHLKWTSAPARPLSRTPKARPRVEEPSEERPEPAQTLHRQEGTGADKTKGAKGSSEREDFERATLALKEGELKPSIRSMTKHFQRGTDTVAAWFRRWEKAGLVTRTETGRFKVAARV